MKINKEYHIFRIVPTGTIPFFFAKKTYSVMKPITLFIRKRGNQNEDYSNGLCKET